MAAEEDIPPPPWKLTGGVLNSGRTDESFNASKQTDIDQKATSALGELAEALAALPEDVLSRMSADQRRDFRDVCVELRTAGTGRELAQDAVMQELSDALYEARDVRAASLVVRQLALPPSRSPERAALARRLTCAARYAQMFEVTPDPENDAQLGKLAAALTAAAVAVAAGTTADAATRAAVTPAPTRDLSLGPLTLQVTAKGAAFGSALALGLSYAGARIASIYNDDPSANLDMAVAATRADTIAIQTNLQESFGDIAGVLGTGLSALSLVVGLGLFALTLSMVEENFDDMES